MYNAVQCPGCGHLFAEGTLKPVPATETQPEMELCETCENDWYDNLEYDGPHATLKGLMSEQLDAVFAVAGEKLMAGADPFMVVDEIEQAVREIAVKTIGATE